MILSPGILALISTSVLSSIMVAAAAGHGLQILLKWDITSGSQLQLTLERKTYLISVMVSVALGAQLLALFLFIMTASDLRTLLVGAMCAAGVLNANGFGYPVLYGKIAGFTLGGLWLILNQADNMGCDYPLIRPKYALLLLIAPLNLLETVLQILYFAGLKPDIITSCCGSLFSMTAPERFTDLAVMPARPLLVAFFAGGMVAIATGLHVIRTGRGGSLFGSVSLFNLPLAIAAMIAAISPYIYELPTHHCPFCILQPEYHAIGYLFYLLLLVASVAGMGAGLLNRWRGRASLQGKLERYQRHLVFVALGGYGLLLTGVLCLILRSNLVVSGY